jgi:lipid-A-disaccharide synthase
MKLFVSTGEISGDLNAAIVVREIKKLRPDIQIVACGGEQLRSAGVDALLDSNPIRVMGFFEVFLRLPRILSFFRKYKSFILEHHPDAFLLVDAPGFHFKFLKFYLTFKKPMFYLIPPKVWVWKKQRLAQMKRFLKKIYRLSFQKLNLMNQQELQNLRLLIFLNG